MRGRSRARVARHAVLERPRRREHRLERAVRAQQLGGRLRADAGRAGQAVGGVAAQRDEVRHLLGLDAVALAHLRRPELGRPSRPCRLEHGDTLSLTAPYRSRSPVSSSARPPAACSRRARRTSRRRPRVSRCRVRSSRGSRAAAGARCHWSAKLGRHRLAVGVVAAGRAPRGSWACSAPMQARPRAADAIPACAKRGAGGERRRSISARSALTVPSSALTGCAVSVARSISGSAK